MYFWQADLPIEEKSVILSKFVFQHISNGKHVNMYK